MTSKIWDERFLQLAKHIATWSKDPSSGVGAVIVRDNKLIVGLGYNGFPRGVEDSQWRLNNRDLKYKYTVHAEANAIIMAGDKAKGATLYVYPTFVFVPPVCTECAKLSIQSGIKEIVGYNNRTVDKERAKRWAESIETAKTMCDEAGVSYRGVDFENV